MQVQHVGHRIRGFYRLADYALRWGMIAPDAQRRLQILDFWRRHGLDATREAFQVSRRTLFGWRAKLKAEGGNLAALVPRSTAPKRRRQRQWPPALLEEIRRLRTLYPKLGKEKLHRLLNPSPTPTSSPAECAHHRPAHRRCPRQDAQPATPLWRPRQSQARAPTPPA